MTTGRIDYSPDYKSEKPAAANFVHVTGPISCVRCDYTTKGHHEAGLSYAEQQRIFDRHLEARHPGWQGQTHEQVERARLRDAVIEKCVAEYRAGETLDHHPTRETSNAYTHAENEREAAVAALIEFESQEQ